MGRVATVALLIGLLAPGTLQAAAQNPERIIATARAHLTVTGTAWAQGEGQRLRNGDINPLQVEKDAAAVRGGLQTDASPDELVLIALVNARSAGNGTAGDALANMQDAPQPDSAPGQLDKAKLEQRIAAVLETLGDTQRPSDPPG